MKLAVLGATGGTGLEVVKQALEAGHEVRALARTPQKLTPHPRLTVVQGEVHQAEAVAALVAGCDAVISALGPRPGQVDACSAGTAAVLKCRPGRYVVVSGAGLDMPGDRKGLMNRFISFLVRTLGREVFQDKVKERDLLLGQREVPFVLVRPPQLLDGPGTGKVQASLVESQGTSITRADLAAFCLQCLGDDTYLGAGPFVSGG